MYVWVKIHTHMHTNTLGNHSHNIVLSFYMYKSNNRLSVIKYLLVACFRAALNNKVLYNEK